MSIANHCIPANSDISGIGVRIAIYAQNFLSFIPALYALSDKKVTRTELDSLETQSTTILITAFAILISAVVQALLHGLSNFHATIVLNLSWMNNTNTFIYFLLYIHHKNVPEEKGKGDEESGLWEGLSVSGVTWARRAKMLSKDPVLILGSLHLSLMAVVGIWLWSGPAIFGSSSSSSCSMSSSVIIFGGGVPLASTGLRLWSIIIYSILLLPGLNLIIPASACIFLYRTYNHAARRSVHRQMSIVPVHIGLIVLGVINVVFVADTEASIQRNAPFLKQGDSESEWTFGQTLALLLLLVPARDLVETFLERRKKQIEDAKALVMAEERERARAAAAARATVDLLNATEKRDFGRVKECIERGANVNGRGGKYGTALQAAAYGGASETIKFLIEKGADVNTQGGEHGTALQAAACWGSLASVKLLVEKGADVNIQGGTYGTALQAAARSGTLEIVKFLVENGADVNSRGGEYGTALQAAAYSVLLDKVKFLVEKGADVNTQGGEYGTALQAAACKGHLDAVEFLVGQGADVNSQGGKYGTALQAAAYNGSWDAVEFLVEKGADVNIQGGEYGTALQASAYEGDVNVVKCLVENGADVNGQGGEYGTALQAAAFKGDLEVVGFLVRQGADVNSQGGKYGSPLQAAYDCQHDRIAKFLKKKGAKDSIITVAPTS